MKGKTALVTGSAGGLGLSIVRGLAAAGCNVVLHGLDPVATMHARCAGLAQAHGVRVDYRHADLAEPHAIASMVRGIADSTGGIDILVNDAVVRHMALIDGYPVQHRDMALAINLTTKTAPPGLTRAVAVEAASDGITCNADRPADSALTSARSLCTEP